jgi:hypothetical protein
MADVELDRPALHQVVALDWVATGWRAATAVLEEALRHVQPALPEEIGVQLGQQWAEAAQHAARPDERRSLLKSVSLHPVAKREGLQGGIWAWQEGTCWLVHLVWQWEGCGAAEVFGRVLAPCLWPAGHQPGLLGQAHYLTAVLLRGEPPGAAAGILEAWHSPGLEAQMEPANHGGGNGPAPARRENGRGIQDLPAPLRLDGLTLFAGPTPRPEPPPCTLEGVLLFDAPEVESDAAIGRLMLELALVALYRLRLEGCYQSRYRQELGTELTAQRVALEEALERHFAVTGEEHVPALLQRGRLRAMERALTDLSVPQFGLERALAQGEETLALAKLDLGNLERVLARVANLHPQAEGARPASEAELEATKAALVERPTRDVAQMQADLAYTRLLTQRATRAVNVLRTRADIEETGYERWLVIVGSFVGAVLAMAEFLDVGSARLLWDSLWGTLDLPGPALTDVQALGWRLALMLVGGGVFTLATALLMALYHRLGGRRRLWRP